MPNLIPKIESQLAALSVPIALELPDGRRVSAPGSRVTLAFSDWSALTKLAARQIGAIGEAYVEGRVQIEGKMRDLIDAAAGLVPGNPAETDTRWWSRLQRRSKSRGAHSLGKDASQIEFHYDVSDDFYALWLDARRVYSCAYFRTDDMTLAQAQEAKLDHICRKLRLQSGERYLDIGSGWGALLIWAAEHYGVDATGITLSKNQHAHVQRLIEAKGLQGRVRVELLDYRKLDTSKPFDKISSVGMFEHVGAANMALYFKTLYALLAPGGLVMNHGITAGQVGARQLGAGMGDFIEKYIFPGGELLHVSHVLRDMASAGLEMVDTENLRPHYARTLWAWSDALEAQLDEARRVLERTRGRAGNAERVLRAYRLYLAGSAMSFEQGWISLHQMLAARPDGNLSTGSMRGSQSVYPFVRDYIYNQVRPCMLYRFKSRATQDFVMLEAHARQLFDIIGKSHSPSGIVTVDQMPAAISALEAAVAQERSNAHNHDKFAVEDHDNRAEAEHVGLGQRAAPLLHMLKDSLADSKDVTWGT